MFRLNIECTKDITDLKISFSDGTSVITSTEPIKVQETKQTKLKESKDVYLNVDEEFDTISQEVVQPPIITRENKPIKVASELQNFDF